MNASRLCETTLKILLLSILIGFGIAAENSLIPQTKIEIAPLPYWLSVALLSICLLLHRPIRSLISYLRFKARMNRRIPGQSKERQTLLLAAKAIHMQQEERALALLDALSSVEDASIRKWVNFFHTFAGVRVTMRRKRVLSIYRTDHPQLHGLIFSHGTLPLRRQLLSRDLVEIPSSALDKLVERYVLLIDLLLEELKDPCAPFHSEAEGLLEFVTGRVYVLGAADRFQDWWQHRRPQLIRGGGAFLVTIRLCQREFYVEASQLLARLSLDGLFSHQTEVLQRCAAYFALLAKTQWRLTRQDIPGFFDTLYFYKGMSLGVLRYPNAEMSEVIEACRRAKRLQRRKISLIEDALALWADWEDEVAATIAQLLKHLLEHKGKKCPLRLSYWSALWQERKPELDRTALATMQGLVAVADKDFLVAKAHFEEAMTLDPESSTPLVDTIYLYCLTGRQQRARQLAGEAIRRFGNDAQTLLSLGRIFESRLNDALAAEDLYQRARSLDKSALEPLLRLGELKYAEGKYTDSQYYFDYAKQMDPHCSEARMGLARIYVEARRFELALDNLRDVVRDENGETRCMANYLLYRTHRELGKDEEAFKYLDRIPPQFFKEPEVLDEIAFDLERKHRFEKARIFSNRAMLLRARRFDLGDGSGAIVDL